MKFKKLTATIKEDHSSYYIDEKGKKYPNWDIRFYLDGEEIENIESVESIPGETNKVKLVMKFDEIDSPHNKK